MPGPDLTPARRAVNRLMEDECVIERNPDGVADSGLDRETGELAAPDPEWVKVYEGPCLIVPTDARETAAAEGDETVYVKDYTLRVPWDADELMRDDRVTITASRRDPLLPGKVCWVRGVKFTTLLISREAVVERRHTP